MRGAGVGDAAHLLRQFAAGLAHGGSGLLRDAVLLHSGNDVGLPATDEHDVAAAKGGAREHGVNLRADTGGVGAAALIGGGDARVPLCKAPAAVVGRGDGEAVVRGKVLHPAWLAVVDGVEVAVLAYVHEVVANDEEAFGVQVSDDGFAAARCQHGNGGSGCQPACGSDKPGCVHGVLCLDERAGV